MAAVSMRPALSLRHLSKTFGPAKALESVSLEVAEGEVHALLGENGAGKSTLMKLLSGALQPDTGGEMRLFGQPYAPASPAEGRAAGVAMIYQELALAPHLSVEENMFLGREQQHRGFVKPQTQEAREALALLGHEDIAPQARVGSLPPGKQQLVEIARAIAARARIVIMDEPTSSLGPSDVAHLFRAIRRMKEKGITILYISHFLEEAQAICDSYTVLRDGRSVISGTVAGSSPQEWIRHMVGRELGELYPRIPHTQVEVLLEVRELRAVGDGGVSFALRRGEIMGIAGLIGSGRSEAARAIFGLEAGQQGRLRAASRPELDIRWLDPPRALGLGINLLSEDRKNEGLAQERSIRDNLTLSRLGPFVRRGLLRPQEEAQSVAAWMERLRIKAGSPDQAARSLSGGNQQKICFARLLHHDSDILFLDEPTRGIDVGSKAEIYRLIQELAAQGKAIVFISSYLPELFGVGDTLAVMHKGSLSPLRPTAAWSQSSVMHYATQGELPASSD